MKGLRTKEEAIEAAIGAIMELPANEEVTYTTLGEFTVDGGGFYWQVNAHCARTLGNTLEVDHPFDTTARLQRCAETKRKAIMALAQGEDFRP